MFGLGKTSKQRKKEYLEKHGYPNNSMSFYGDDGSISWVMGKKDFESIKSKYKKLK